MSVSGFFSYLNFFSGQNTENAKLTETPLPTPILDKKLWKGMTDGSMVVNQKTLDDSPYPFQNLDSLKNVKLLQINNLNNFNPSKLKSIVIQDSSLDNDQIAKLVNSNKETSQLAFVSCAKITDELFSKITKRPLNALYLENNGNKDKTEALKTFIFETASGAKILYLPNLDIDLFTEGFQPKNLESFTGKNVNFEAAPLSLKHVSAFGGKIEGVGQLAERLQNLSFNGVQFLSTDFLENCNVLKTLKICACKIQTADGPADLLPRHLPQAILKNSQLSTTYQKEENLKEEGLPPLDCIWGLCGAEVANLVNQVNAKVSYVNSLYFEDLNFESIAKENSLSFIFNSLDKLELNFCHEVTDETIKKFGMQFPLKLKALSLINIEELTGESLIRISWFENLESFTLKGTNKVDFEAYAKEIELWIEKRGDGFHSLEIPACPSKYILPFSEFSNLNFLSLADADFTESNVPPNLSYLIANSLLLSEDSSEVFKDLPNLKKLKISQFETPRSWFDQNTRSLKSETTPFPDKMVLGNAKVQIDPIGLQPLTLEAFEKVIEAAPSMQITLTPAASPN